MKRAFLPKAIAAAFVLAVTLAASRDAFGAATIVILNNDSANAGFNDPTPVSPVGNNTGTTLGQQRLNAFQFAANIWGATINSSVTITVRASWAALSCSSTSGVLGQTSAVSIFRDFPNAPKSGTWYPASLANALAGKDLDPSATEINAQFNSNLGNTGCLDGTHFYLGLDNKIPVAKKQIADFYNDRLPTTYSSISANLDKVGSESGVRVSGEKFAQKESGLEGLDRGRFRHDDLPRSRGPRLFDALGVGWPVPEDFPLEATQDLDGSVQVRKADRRTAGLTNLFHEPARRGQRMRGEVEEPHQAFQRDV